MTPSINQDIQRQAILSNFKDWLKSPDLDFPYSDHTIRAYLRHARRFLEFVADIHVEHLEEVNKAAVRGYLKENAQGLSSSTRTQIIASIESFFDFASTNALCETNPARGFRAENARRKRGGRAEKKLAPFLYPSETEQLIGSIFSGTAKNRERNLAIVGLMLDSGVRTSELSQLKVRDIQSMLTNRRLQVVGKGGKERIIVPLQNFSDHTQRYLDLRMEQGASPGDYFFVTRNNLPIKQPTVHYILKKHLNKLHISKSQFGGHLLRHTSGTMMLSEGMNMRRVQDNLGHANINTTQIYTHLVDSWEGGSMAKPFTGISK